MERVKVLVQGQAVVSTGSGSAGVGILGVDPEAERGLLPLAEKIETIAKKIYRADGATSSGTTNGGSFSAPGSPSGSSSAPAKSSSSPRTTSRETL